jgi:hypothetical protein
MKVKDYEWLDYKILRFRLETDKDKDQYHSVLTELLDPMLWESRGKSEMHVRITEKSKDVLELLGLQEGQVFTLSLDWDRADYGVYGTRISVDDQSGQGGTGRTMVTYKCGVRAPYTGNIPELAYRYSMEKLNGLKGLSSFFQAINKSNPTAEHAVTLSDYHAEDVPWSTVEFANRTYSGPRVIVNGKELEPDEVVKDALFIFDTCYNSMSDSPYGGQYAFMRQPCPEFTQETCAQKIRELAGDDFYGVTGFRISGNVENYRVIW